MPSKTHVLIVDDSPTSRQVLAEIVTSADDLTVAGVARDGKQAVDMTTQLKPDVILMDIVMPNMDGLQATREIMYQKPTPIVLVSASLESYETDIAFQAIKAGALTVLQKPGNVTGLQFREQAAFLQNTLRSMAGVRVIRHWRKAEKAPQPAVSAQQPVLPSVCPEIIAIVASTGGPAALAEVVRKLPPSFKLPVVIVQHIAPDFVPSLTDWLRSVAALPVIAARAGDEPRPGTIYLAPGNAHLRLNTRGAFEVDTTRNGKLHMPSGDVLFESLCHFHEKAVGIILTGMGSDGAMGLKAMANAGALTIAQDEATSVVYGMPQEAARIGAARLVLPVSQIGDLLALIAQMH